MQHWWYTQVVSNDNAKAGGTISHLHTTSVINGHRPIVLTQGSKETRLPVQDLRKRALSAAYSGALQWHIPQRNCHFGRPKTNFSCSKSEKQKKKKKKKKKSSATPACYATGPFDLVACVTFFFFFGEGPENRWPSVSSCWHCWLLNPPWPIAPFKYLEAKHTWAIVFIHRGENSAS